MVMAGDPDIVEILTIALGGEIFALPAGIVLEVLDIGPVTPVPNVPAFVGNLINFRGRVAPLADLRPRCGMTVTPADGRQPHRGSGVPVRRRTDPRRYTGRQGL